MQNGRYQVRVKDGSVKNIKEQNLKNIPIYLEGLKKGTELKLSTRQGAKPVEVSEIRSSHVGVGGKLGALQAKADIDYKIDLTNKTHEIKFSLALGPINVSFSLTDKLDQ